MEKTDGSHGTDILGLVVCVPNLPPQYVVVFK